MPITPATAAELLARASARDNREVTRAMAIAWSEDLDDVVSLADGSAAISAHYRRTRDWIMPADINTAVRAMRKERTDRISDLVPPGELADHPRAEAAWKREYTRAIGNGDQHDVAWKAACDALRIDAQQIEGARRMPAVGHLTREVPRG